MIKWATHAIENSSFSKAKGGKFFGKGTGSKHLRLCEPRDKIEDVT